MSSFAVPFHSKETKEESVRRDAEKLPSPVPRRSSREHPESELRRMRLISLGSPSDPGKQTPPNLKPTLPKFKVDPKTPSYYTITITKVDPENIPACYCPCTLKLASEEEDIPSSSHYSSTSMVDTEEELEPPPPTLVFCGKCGTEHHPPFCAISCKACFDPHHTSADCPLFDRVPKGAVFDRVNYEIICRCGNMFNEDKWVCVLCNGRPKLQPKYCVFCASRRVQHSSYECPKDKVGAAQIKAKRDEAFSCKFKPYTPFHE